MTKIESFLKSNIYLFIISVLGFVAWVVPSNYLWINNSIIILLSVLIVLILTFIKDTKYIIPILISLFFTINVQQIGSKDIEGITLYHAVLGLFLIGIIIHFIRFKDKLKFDLIALTLLLIGISYLIPMFFIPFSGVVFYVSITGILYFLIYIFFISSSEIKTEELLNYFFFSSIQLLAILFYSIGTSFYELILVENLTDTITKGLKSGWNGTDYGFGNVNDLTIYLAILSSGIFYKIIKKPKNYLYWLFVILNVVAVILSGSRGGIITLFLILVVSYIILYKKGTKPQFVFANLLIISFLIFMALNKDIFLVLYENFMQGGLNDLDSFSSGRIKLFKEATDLFLKKPIFGVGWTTFEEINTDRLQVFHSTIFHTLAISGLFGLFSVILFFIFGYKEFIKKKKLNVILLAVPWTMTNIHGLFDNTIHMVIFTLLTIFIFTAVKNEDIEVETNYKENFKYLTEKQTYNI